MTEPYNGPNPADKNYEQGSLEQKAAGENGKKYFIMQLLRETQDDTVSRTGRRDPIWDKYIKMGKQGKNPLHQLVTDSEQIGLDPQLIEKVVNTAKINGEWWEDYAIAAKEVMGALAAYRRGVNNAPSDADGDHAAAIDQLDPRRDADLIAHLLFIHPEIRAQFKNNIEHLYRAVLRYRWNRTTRGPRELPYRTEPTTCEGTGTAEKSRVFSEGLEALIDELPAEVFSKDDPHYTNLLRLIRKKANREALIHFKKDPESGLSFLQKNIAIAKNDKFKRVYEDVLTHYQNYASFEFAGENKNFRDPVTGQTGSFPSIHQRIGVYHALDKQRFGILDGCGTGKTAIGALMYPLVKQRKANTLHNWALVQHALSPDEREAMHKMGDDQIEQIAKQAHVPINDVQNLVRRKKRAHAMTFMAPAELDAPNKITLERIAQIATDSGVPEDELKAFVGSAESHQQLVDRLHLKVHNRILVVGTIPCLKTWKKGFEGGDRERYLADKRKVMVVNGHSSHKDDALYEELKNAEIVFANYQQLSAKFKHHGTVEPVYKVLASLGYDLIVFDEVHNIKNRKDTTKSGKETHSAAARHLAFHDKDAYFLLLSGTPMPDNLRDYAMIYHLLRPDQCKDPAAFVKTIEDMSYDPHTLSTFVDDNTLRRTAEEVNDLIELDRDHWYDDIELSDAQRAIHNHLLSHRPRGWLMEVRKAMLDPRLVDPRILQRLGLLGKVTVDDAVKYKRLEELVTGQDGPLKKNEKFVVFSSTLKEGITRVAQKIERTYANLGLQETYKTLGLQENLHKRLDDAVKRKYGNEKYIGIIDGNVLGEEREALANQFNKDPNLVGLICTTETGGESLDFSHATHGYFLDEDYSPATTVQAVGRLWRRGQTKPVTIKSLRGYDSVDDCISEYVDKKSLVIKIALDGHPPTKDEIALLKDSENKKHQELTNMILNRFGGLSVDASAYKDFELSDIIVKTHNPPTPKTAEAVLSVAADILEPSIAQEIAKRIGQDPKCWFDPEFAKKYADALGALSPYFIHRAKILDLIARANRKEIAFPENVLSLGSGPSILWDAYQSLEGLLQSQGLWAPDVHDLDFSQEMLKHGKNPVKIFANMRHVPARAGSYDMVDNASISLLHNAAQIEQSLREANRVLKDGGLLELSVKRLYFMDGFHDALRQLGFAPMTKKHNCFGLSKSAYKKISEEHGHGFAEAFRSKIEGSHFILARKTGEPQDVQKPKDLWFLSELGETHVPFEKPAPAPDQGDVSGTDWPHRLGKKRRGRRVPKKHDDTPTPTRPYAINKDGTVDSLGE